MQDYLTVRDYCSVCSEELYHHRADDGPAWATILISGHLLAPLMLLVFQCSAPRLGDGTWFFDDVPAAVTLLVTTPKGNVRSCAVGQPDARLRG